jgi:hypothetical protein
MSVRGHRDQIALSIFRRFQNSFGRIAQREKSVHGQTAGPQSLGRTFQVSAVVFHLLRLGELELLEISRNESIRDVHEQQFRAVQFRELADVRQKRFIRAAVFESDENFLIHNQNARPTQALIPVQSHRYFPFTKIIAAAVIQANV